MKNAFWVVVHGVTLILAISGLVSYFGQSTIVIGQDEGQITQVESVVYFPSVSNEPDPNKVLEYVNSLRASEGLEKLRSDSVLLNIASQRADDMVANSYYAHKNKQGKIFYEIMEDEGVAPVYACENLALESGVDEKPYFTSWLTSTKGHKECMLNPKVTRAGYAVRKLYDTDSGPYYVVVAIHGNKLAIDLQFICKIATDLQ